MRLLVFSDIHNDYGALESLMDREADAYFAAGDLTSWSNELERVGKILSRRGDKVYVLPGNHESESMIEDMCQHYGLNCFHRRVMKMGDYHVAGLGYSNPTPFNTPGEYSEEQLARRLSAFSDLKPLILICHCPPHGTALDRVRKDLHSGSHSVREFIETHQPEYFCCGHIHEAEGVIVKIGKTVAANVGKRGHLLDFDKLGS